MRCEALGIRMRCLIHLQIWDISAFTGQQPTEPVIIELSLWRAHKMAITSLDFVYDTGGCCALPVATFELAILFCDGLCTGKWQAWKTWVGCVLLCTAIMLVFKARLHFALPAMQPTSATPPSCSALAWITPQGEKVSCSIFKQTCQICMCGPPPSPPTSLGRLNALLMRLCAPCMCLASAQFCGTL